MRKTENSVYILLVDDRPANLIALQAILDTGEYVVVTAYSGHQALSLLESQDFAVILTDVMMPGMDGLEFACEVKKNERLKDIPIIFMTAMAADMGDVFQGYAAGAVDYLLKPLEPEFVKAKVAVFAQMYRQRRLIDRQAALHQALAEASRMALVHTSWDLLILESAPLLHRALSVDASSLIDWAPAKEGYSLRSYLGCDRALFDDFVDRNQVWFCQQTADFRDMSQEQMQPLNPLRKGVAFTIQGSQEILGFLCLFHRETDAYSHDELSFLKSFCNILSVACERYRSENEVRKLTRSNSELEHFSFAASHDLQEPLRKLISFAALLQKDYRDKLDTNGQNYIDYISDGAKRMKTLISDFLEFSHIGSESIANRRISLAACLDNAVANLEMQIVETGARFECDDLPEIQADPSAMVSLFQNLLSNALKYRSEASPLVRISCEKQGGHWKISVRDNGIGIDAAYLEKIFMMLSVCTEETAIRERESACRSAARSSNGTAGKYGRNHNLERVRPSSFSFPNEKDGVSASARFGF